MTREPDWTKPVGETQLEWATGYEQLAIMSQGENRWLYIGDDTGAGYHPISKQLAEAILKEATR